MKPKTIGFQVDEKLAQVIQESCDIHPGVWSDYLRDITSMPARIKEFVRRFDSIDWDDIDEQEAFHIIVEMLNNVNASFYLSLLPGLILFEDRYQKINSIRSKKIIKLREKIQED